MQYQSFGLELLNEPVPLDPGCGYTHAGRSTHTPDTTLTFLHCHDSLELGYCYEGSGVFIVDNRIMPFKAGCASIIFQNEIHIAQSSAEYGSKWRFVNLDAAALLGRTFPDATLPQRVERTGLRGIVAPDDPSGIAPIICELIEETRRKDLSGRQAVAGLTLCLFARLARHSPEAETEGEAAPGGLARISHALDHIVQHHAQPIYIGELAALCKMSVATFRRAFMQAMGVAPNGYINALRIQLAAQELVHSSSSVLDIGYIVGYDTPSSFHRQFKRIMGVSPRAYRNGATAGSGS